MWEGPHPSPPRPKPASSHFLRLALVTLKAERIQSVESNSLTSAEFFMIINTKGNPYLLISRRFLRHQYNVKLNRRTQQIQEELVSLSGSLVLLVLSFEKHVFRCLVTGAFS